MLPFLTLLLVCQLAGELVARLLALPVPGPVVGLLLLLTGLAVRGRPAAVDEGADALLAHLSMLFVPAGVGVVQFLPLLADQWAAVAVSVVGSAVAAVAVTGLVLQALLRRRQPAEPAPVEP